MNKIQHAFSLRRLRLTRFFVLIIFASFLFVPSPVSSAIDELRDHKAKLFDFRGDVKIMKKGQANWTGVKKDLLIEEGDRLKTAKQSYAEIAYDKFFLNIARVGEDTEVEFRAIEPTDVYLKDGGVFNILDGLPKGSTYEISTATAVAGVRGTRFETNYDEETQQFDCDTYSGSVGVFPVDETGDIVEDLQDRVEGGNELSFERGNFEGRAENPIDPQEMQDAMNYVESVQDRFQEEQQEGQRELRESEQAPQPEGEGESGGEGPGAGGGTSGGGAAGTDAEGDEFNDAYRSIYGKEMTGPPTFEEANAVHKQLTGEDLSREEYDQHMNEMQSWDHEGSWSGDSGSHDGTGDHTGDWGDPSQFPDYDQMTQEQQEYYAQQYDSNISDQTTQDALHDQYDGTITCPPHCS